MKWLVLFFVFLGAFVAAFTVLALVSYKPPEKPRAVG